MGDTIVYNYRPSGADSSAYKLRSCLRSESAEAARERIRNIVVMFPISGYATGLQQPLLDIAQALPSLEYVKYEAFQRLENKHKLSL